MSRLSSLKKQETSTSLVAVNNLLASINRMDNRSVIAEIEHLTDNIPAEEKSDYNPADYFGDNVFVRTFLFKKNTIAIGRVAKLDHVSILISGHMTIWTPQEGLHEVRGPLITEAPHGTKRFGYAHTDTLWACAYGVQNKEHNDPEHMLDLFSFEKYGEYLDFLNTCRLEGY